jgi:hypothetical protein
MDNQVFSLALLGIIFKQVIFINMFPVKLVPGQHGVVLPQPYKND